MTIKRDDVDLDTPDHGVDWEMLQASIEDDLVMMEILSGNENGTSLSIEENGIRIRKLSRNHINGA